MARARNIKPGFFKNEELVKLNPLCRLLFAGIWCLADRDGRLEDRPGKIKIEILPCDDADADTFLNDLQEAGFIKRYTANNNRYIQIINFKQHQNPHKNEAPSVIPPPNTLVAPEEHSESTIQIPEEHSDNPACNLLLVTDSLNINIPFEEKLDNLVKAYRDKHPINLKKYGMVSSVSKARDVFEAALKQNTPYETLLQTINSLTKELPPWEIVKLARAEPEQILYPKVNLENDPGYIEFLKRGGTG